MTNFLTCVHDLVWGVPTLALILGMGLWLTVRTRAAQLRLLPRAAGHFWRGLRSQGNGEGVSSFQALCTALAATVGTGNIAGVAGAICLGGPGAVFWMWVGGFFGMVTKYMEVTLAVRFRVREQGSCLGGPMYLICQGMGPRFSWLARLYCVFGILAAFGVGSAAQVNAMLSSLSDWHPLSSRQELAIGLILAAVAGLALMGGARRIGEWAELLIPLASAGYMGLCLMALIFRWQALPGALSAIVTGAFSPRAVTGGAVGSLLTCLRTGCSRGVFTNEAGMGTAAIAHAGAEDAENQSLMGIWEVFLDTLVMCTLTALVVLTSGAAVPYGTDAGGSLTGRAFSLVLGDWTRGVLAGAMVLFAFSTVLGWGLYGARCARFLFGRRGEGTFFLLHSCAAALGAVGSTGAVFLLCGIFNGLMAIPNLLSMAYVLRRNHTEKPGSAAGGGNYADFHQCQPLRALSHAEIPPLRRKGGAGGKEDLSPEHRSAGPAHPSCLL